MLCFGILHGSMKYSSVKIVNLFTSSEVSVWEKKRLFFSFSPFWSGHREERNQTQVLRQQQDEAYLASLRADQEKERKKREERERKRRKEEEVQQQKLAEERRRRVMSPSFPPCDSQTDLNCERKKLENDGICGVLIPCHFFKKISSVSSVGLELMIKSCMPYWLRQPAAPSLLFLCLLQKVI